MRKINNVNFSKTYFLLRTIFITQNRKLDKKVGFYLRYIRGVSCMEPLRSNMVSIEINNFKCICNKQHGLFHMYLNKVILLDFVLRVRKKDTSGIGKE